MQVAVFKRMVRLGLTEKVKCRDFPGGPVARTLCFQCRGPGFDPWFREIDHTHPNQEFARYN